MEHFREQLGGKTISDEVEGDGPNCAMIYALVQFTMCLQFTFHLMQRLKSNAVTDVGSGIWNLHPSEEIQKSRITNSLHRFDIRETPGLQTNVKPVPSRFDPISDSPRRLNL
ncbi:hypothetical protein J6590_042129 [Homalodisca vitripennis]|nr:hypothetical protein J6590_042129 [Homalodisca vitripennis]